jgi:hypothetical protein
MRKPPSQLALGLTPLHVGDQLPTGWLPDFDSYHFIIVAFSGGKDSIACVLHLLELGVPRERIELWHHEVDGHEGRRLFDWPCTRSYCQKIAAALGIRIFFSWREGGLEREMLRNNAPTAAVWFEDQAGQLVRAGGVSNRLNTRLRFPQVGSDLNTRWCSPYGKIMVADTAINNQDRFLNKRTLFVTGERAQESTSRAKYAIFEPHRTDNRDGPRRRRHVDHFRPVHGWNEISVWKIIERWRINPHPCYRLGWSRDSCATCIFGGNNHWASLEIVLPGQFDGIATYEAGFDVTIDRGKRTVCQRAAAGQAFQMDPAVIEEARAEDWAGQAILAPGAWALPPGAFGSPDSGPC